MPVNTTFGVVGRESIQDILDYHHFVINESPLLASYCPEGEDGDSIHFSWVDEDGGGTYTVPYSAFDEAELTDDSITVEDDQGDRCDITLFRIEKVQANLVYTLE
jgi:hypothetical protein